MKKQLLSLLAFLATGALFSQSIPNGSFENWTMTSFEDPQFFMTSNSDSHNSVPNPVNATKTTDSWHGAFAVKLTTMANGPDTAFAYIANGQPGNPAAGGVPYNQKPTGLHLYYKSDIKVGDTALIIAEFKLAGSVIGMYLYKMTGTHASYTLFNPTFSPALPATPDTVIFACASSNAMTKVGIAPGSMIQLDSVSFTGVSSQPVNFNGDFELWQVHSQNHLNNWFCNGAVSQTTDKYAGAYAVEIQTAGGGFGNNGPQNGTAGTGDSNMSGWTHGYPFTNQVDTLIFYYKYIPANAGDSAQLYGGFKKNGVTVSGLGIMLGLSVTYKKVQIPINVGQVPDTMILRFQSSKIWPPTASDIGSDLKVDEIYLKSQRIPISNFNMPLTGCVGQPVQLQDNSANMPTSWNWIMGSGNPSNSTAENPTVTYNSVGTFTVSMVATDSFGSGSLISKTITIYSLPTVSATSATLCPNATATLTASGASTYTWNTGATGATLTVSPSSSTAYTVIGTSAQGCSSGAIGIVMDRTIAAPDICEVTVDATSTNNIVYWDKTPYKYVDSFIVYREVSTNTYSRIGAQLFSDSSKFIDVNRSVGPANGDPNVGSYRYKLQIRDSCGNYGPLGNYHNTIYFIDLHTGTFNWNLYSIQTQTATPVSNFNLLRDNANNGTWIIIGTVAGTQTSLNDPAYVTYQGIANWRVEALGFNCTPTARYGNNANQSSVVRSKSNITNNRVTGIGQYNSSNNFLVYPNPSAGNISVSLSENLKDLTIEIVNPLGQKVLVEKTGEYKAGTERKIDLSSLAKGLYIIRVNSYTRQLILSE